MFEPAGPHGLFDAATGAEIPEYPPHLFKRYGYHDPGFKALEHRWKAGTLVYKRWDDPAPLTAHRSPASST